jgi:hypothetical protein
MASIPKHLEGFHGSNLGSLNYEILSIQNFKHKDVAYEPQLMLTKWFDYRRLHHIQATYYFMKCYMTAYREFIRTSVDAARAPYVRCIKEHDFLEAREKLSFLRLRQMADTLGIPYDFFIGRAMSLHYRMCSPERKKGERQSVYAPRPSHIGSNEELIGKIITAWERQCEAYMNVAKDPFYKIKNFIGAPDQLAHEAWVIKQIKNRTHPKFALHNALYKSDTVRIEEAIQHFSQHTLLAAISEKQVS